MAKKLKLSRISVIHYSKLVYRTILLITAIIMYIFYKVKNIDDLLAFLDHTYILLGLIWIIYVVEMIFRFFPSNNESMGCQKQFKKNYIPIENGKVELLSKRRTLLVAIVWIIFNGIIGLLYYLSVIDEGILILISLTYGVCDMICILFFCPFQTWFMKNRCCTGCRIYNWDFLMMFTPCIFIPHLYTWSLLAISLILFLRWEITVYKYPERFSDKTNQNLLCVNCKEKLCHHKKQLISFWNKNKARLKINKK